MGNMTEQRIADLKAKLAAREKIPAYAENCKAIRAELERLGDPPNP